MGITMEIAHFLHHLKRDRLLLKANIKRAELLPIPSEERSDNFIFKTASKNEYPKAIAIYHKYCGAGVPWLIKLWNKEYEHLCYIIKNDKEDVIGFSFLMFNEAEFDASIVHDLVIVIDEQYRGQGLSTKLQRYCVKSLKQSPYSYISTCVGFNDIKALRACQKAGFHILKQSAKPPSHYLICKLKS